MRRSITSQSRGTPSFSAATKRAVCPSSSRTTSDPIATSSTSHASSTSRRAAVSSSPAPVSASDSRDTASSSRSRADRCTSASRAWVAPESAFPRCFQRAMNATAGSAATTIAARKANGCPPTGAPSTITSTAVIAAAMPTHGNISAVAKSTSRSLERSRRNAGASAAVTTPYSAARRTRTAPRCRAPLASVHSPGDLIVDPVCCKNRPFGLLETIRRFSTVNGTGRCEPRPASCGLLEAVSALREGPALRPPRAPGLLVF